MHARLAEHVAGGAASALPALFAQIDRGEFWWPVTFASTIGELSTHKQPSACAAKLEVHNLSYYFSACAPWRKYSAASSDSTLCLRSAPNSVVSSCSGDEWSLAETRCVSKWCERDADRNTDDDDDGLIIDIEGDDISGQPSPRPAERVCDERADRQSTALTLVQFMIEKRNELKFMDKQLYELIGHCMLDLSAARGEQPAANRLLADSRDLTPADSRTPCHRSPRAFADVCSGASGPADQMYYATDAEPPFAEDGRPPALAAATSRAAVDLTLAPVDGRHCVERPQCPLPSSADFDLPRPQIKRLQSQAINLKKSRLLANIALNDDLHTSLRLGRPPGGCEQATSCEPEVGRAQDNPLNLLSKSRVSKTHTPAQPPQDQLRELPFGLAQDFGARPQEPHRVPMNSFSGSGGGELPGGSLAAAVAAAAAHFKVSYKCHVCNSFFEDRHRLQQHLSIHLQLDKDWYVESTIKKTMALYESKRGDYLCSTCDLRFATTSTFDKHMQIHGEKPHKCELCFHDNSFRYYRQYLTHYRNHCVIYKCRFVESCNHQCNRRDYLKSHILKHHLNNKLPAQYTLYCH